MEGTEGMGVQDEEWDAIRRGKRKGKSRREGRIWDG